MIEELFDRLGGPIVLVPLTILVVCVSWSKAKTQNALPSLPWVGKRSEVFSGTRATYRSFNNVRQWLEEGYEKARDEEAQPPKAARVNTNLIHVLL